MVAFLHHRFEQLDTLMILLHFPFDFCDGNYSNPNIFSMGKLSVNRNFLDHQLLFFQCEGPKS